MENSLSGRHLGAAPSNAAEGFPGRWLGLVGSMWLLACAGNSYNFAIYSSDIKDTLGLSQQQLATLGVAKDVGDNVGLVAGLLGDVVPAWAVICIGLSMNMFGYGMLGLILTLGWTAEYWQVWLLLCIATNGASFFITAGLVTAQRNFPQSGGVVAGIVVGFIGLSGAIFAQIYDTFLAPNTGAFLLLLAAAPAAVAFIACFVVKPYPPPIWSVQGAVEEHSNLRLVLRCCLLLAFFLLSMIILQSLFPASQLLSSFATAGMLFLLLLPALVLAPLTPSRRHALGAPKPKAAVQPADTLPPIAEEDGSSLSGSETSSSASASRRAAAAAQSAASAPQTPIPQYELEEAPQPSDAANLTAAQGGPSMSEEHEAYGVATGVRSVREGGVSRRNSRGASKAQLGKTLSFMAQGLGKNSMVVSALGPSPFSDEWHGSNARRSQSLHTGASQRRSLWQAGDSSSFSQRLMRRSLLQQQLQQQGRLEQQHNQQAQNSHVLTQQQQQQQQQQHGQQAVNRDGIEREQSVPDFSDLENVTYGIEVEGEDGGDWGFYFGEEEESLRANQPLIFARKSYSLMDQSEAEEFSVGFTHGGDEEEDEDGGSPSPLRRPLLAGEKHSSLAHSLAAKKEAVALGEEHTFGEALGTVDFWLMYAGLVSGLGCGLAAISNLAQLSESLGFGTDVQVFTSLLSVWQFLGRLASGSLSEYLVRMHGCPRPLVIAGIQALMISGLLSFAFAIPGSLYIGSLLTGFTYGGLCSLMPVTAGELFGLNSLGMLYNTFLTAAPVGSFVLSGILVGKLYEWEANHSFPPPTSALPDLMQQGMTPHIPLQFRASVLKYLSGGPLNFLIPAASRRTQLGATLVGKAKKCFGPQCFRLIFIILTCVCIFGSFFHVLVAFRTRSLYAKFKMEPEDATHRPEVAQLDAATDSPRK